MAKTPQWIKKLGGHAGELYVCAELSKRGIPNALLPENFADDDVLIGRKDGIDIGYIQVKSCHPDRSKTFILRENHESWVTAPKNQYVVLVWLGSPSNNEAPRYWVTTKRAMGRACQNLPSSGTTNWERRFAIGDLNTRWENNWGVFDRYRPQPS